MSSDLLAAFGGEPSPNAVNTTQAADQSFPIYQTPHQPPQDSVDEDDEFGDFEDASASNAPPGPKPDPVISSTQVPAAEPVRSTTRSPKEQTTSGRSSNLPFSAKPLTKTKPTPQSAGPTEEKSRVGQHPFAGNWDLLFEAGDDEYDAGADELGDLSNNPEAAMAYSKRLIAEQQAAQRRKLVQKSPEETPRFKAKAPEQPTIEQTKSEPKKLQKKSGYAPPTRNVDVLFDAENLSEHDDSGDDFGDFETWEDPVLGSESASTAKSTIGNTALPAIDLLGLDDQESDNVKANEPSSSQARTTQYKQRSNHDRTAQSPTQPKPITTEDMDDGGWDDFETSAPSPHTTAASPPSHQPPPHSSKPTPSVPPPNIPPPLHLLTLFPSLLTSAETALFSTLTHLPLPQRQTLLCHPATHQYLTTYLSHLRVLAHIIAGRKLRWKRDSRLAQSMRIGPSTAGGKGGGMKLAGLDKTELAKEEREVLDVLRLWKEQVGKLRTAVATASAAPGLPKLPSVPDIAEAMPVKVLKSIEGGMTAPHPCALCGLRRDERVARVDVEVEDSFGEWWVEGANMHIGCVRFWEEFERKLKGR